MGITIISYACKIVRTKLALVLLASIFLRSHKLLIILES